MEVGELLERVSFLSRNLLEGLLVLVPTAVRLLHLLVNEKLLILLHVVDLLLLGGLFLELLPDGQTWRFGQSLRLLSQHLQPSHSGLSLSLGRVGGLVQGLVRPRGPRPAAGGEVALKRLRGCLGLVLLVGVLDEVEVEVGGEGRWVGGVGWVGPGDHPDPALVVSWGGVCGGRRGGGEEEVGRGCGCLRNSWSLTCHLGAHHQTFLQPIHGERCKL